MKILIAFAVEAECRSWLAQRRFERPSDGSARWRGRFGEDRVDLVVTGIGPPRARAIRPVLERERPDICIAAGLCGALNPAFGRSTVVVPRAVLNGASRGRTEAPLLADQWLVQQAGAAGATVVPALVSTDRILVRRADKAAWAAGADIVDMESRSVLDAAAACGIPGVAVRSISDEAGEELPLDFNRLLTPDGEVSRARVAFAVARRPWRIGQLVRFGRASLHAAASLVIFLDGYVERIAAAWDGTP